MTERRAQILDAAAQLVRERGFAQTSVEDVIQAAGLSGKSHFYHYFRSKDELGHAMLDRQVQRFTERGLAVLREPMIDPLERFELFIDSLVTAQAERGGRGGTPFGSLASELADSHEAFRRQLDAAFAQWTAQLAALFDEARPSLREDADAARLAQFVIATLEGAVIMTRVRRDVQPMKAIASDLKRYVRTHLRDPAPAVGARRRARGA